MSDSENGKRLVRVTAVLGGDVEMLRELTVKHLGTSDLDEADRRARVIKEYRDWTTTMSEGAS